ASLSSLMLLSSPITGLPASAVKTHHNTYLAIDPISSLSIDLNGLLPHEVAPLSPDQENKIAQVLSEHTGLTVVSELNGIRLNRTYGYIGQEQHLARYPGDTMVTHFESGKERQLYNDKGMAPGLGAWGYFASSRDTMTVKDALREKWYIAVQTFLAP